MTDRPRSATAARVAAYRLGSDRIAAGYGDAAADDALAADVAGSQEVPAGTMARYLQARTGFFDRVVLNALAREITQVVNVGAGYDGRAWRYGKPGVTWWEVDHAVTQADKQARLARLGIDAGQVVFVSHDLAEPGLAEALTTAGFRPDAGSLVICEGVTVYLPPPAVETLLGELRALATVATRLALSIATSTSDADASARREQFREVVAGLGEPALSQLTTADIAGLLERSRWRPVDLSERAQRAGFVLAAPAWEPSGVGSGPPTASVAGRFMEDMLNRSGTQALASHLESAYDIRVRAIKELDLGVHRVDLAGRQRWIARVFPRSRPADSALADAALLGWLADAGFPAERGAHPDAVSVHRGQPVLVTRYVAGRAARANPDTFRLLGELLGRLHGLDPDHPAARRPGGAWHHLVFDAGIDLEAEAMGALLAATRYRVPAAQAASLDALLTDVGTHSGFDGLPQAFGHPDLVPRNVIHTTSGDAVVIDWAGAGLMPRIAPLGPLLWAASAKPANLDAALAGYQMHVTLEPAEWDKLPAAMGRVPLMLAAWSFATGRRSLADTLAWWAAQRTAIDHAVGQLSSPHQS
jgi:methyltransferase (TIGR00027 family)